MGIKDVILCWNLRAHDSNVSFTINFKDIGPSSNLILQALLVVLFKRELRIGNEFIFFLRLRLLYNFLLLLLLLCICLYISLCAVCVPSIQEGAKTLWYWELNLGSLPRTNALSYQAKSQAYIFLIFVYYF